MALLFAAGANNPLAPDFTGESPKTRFEKACAHFHMASHPGNGAILLCRNFFAMPESILIEKTLDGDKKRPESPSLRVFSPPPFRSSTIRAWFWRFSSLRLSGNWGLIHQLPETPKCLFAGARENQFSSE